MANFDRWGNPEMSDEQLFRVMRMALAREPRMVLKKSLPISLIKPKKQPRLLLLKSRQAPSIADMQAVLHKACAMGRITGHDALALEQLIFQFRG